MGAHGISDESAVAHAIRVLGGPVSAARKLSVERYQTVQSWVRENRVPANYCPAVAEATGVPMWELRPDDWHQIWPMLIEAEGAPPVQHAAEAATGEDLHQIRYVKAAKQQQQQPQPKPGDDASSIDNSSK